MIVNIIIDFDIKLCNPLAFRGEWVYNNSGEFYGNGGDVMIVYHGSDTVVDDPRILESKRPLDFGSGFYTTTSEEQAKQWAIKVSYRNANRQRCINRYAFDMEKAISEVTVIHFEIADEKWLDFICANRQGLETGNYDIVIGPVADDRVYRVVVQYENGDVDKESALKKLKVEKLCDQILFHSEKALQYLKYMSTEVMCDE